MEFNPFVENVNPSQDISKELSSVSLEEQYAKLTEKEKLLIWCKLHGFNRIPPTIEQMYSDDYYLGGDSFFDHGSNLFQFWKDNLTTIFPNAVTNAKPFLILSGAIGIGKSTVSRLILAMNYARLLCMANPSKTLGLTPKPFSFVIYHRDEEIARKEFKNWFNYEVLKKSPFFKNVKGNFKLQILTAGILGQAGLGSDVLTYIMSELNFFPNQERARKTLETSYGRFTSRFGPEQLEMVGNLIIDSSASGDNSCTEWFLEQTDPKKTWNCKPTHYSVRPNLYAESKGRTFSVYTGDGKYPPQILAEDYKLGLDQDPEKVLKVPVQLLPEAKMNLEKMLQDKCGISTGSSDSFFGGSVEHLVNCSKGKRNLLEEVYIVDFFDKTDRLIDKIAPALKDIPRQSTIWLGLDLATSSDYTGISAVGFNGWEKINDDTKLPKIKVYFSFAVSRKEGQQTSLFHIFDLIKALSRMYNVIVSADQAFSSQLLQDCERDGIKTNGRISTDNSPCLPALYLKNMIQQELIELPPNRRLFREAYDLRYVTTKSGKVKIDHPKKCTIDNKVFDGDASRGIGSKDVWDSLASACYSFKMSVDAGEELGYSSGYEKQLDLVSRMTNNAREESGKQFQNMVQGIFGEW